jgi:hypothetical protein
MPDDPAQDQPSELERLARARFPEPPLTKAEIKLVQKAPVGELAVCGANAKNADPANDPRTAPPWDQDRQIRAELIRWLCVDRQAKELVDPTGIQIYGANIVGPLKLVAVKVPFPLILAHCQMQELNLRSAELPGINLQGSLVYSLKGDGMKVEEDVYLRHDFLAMGEVRLLGAEIGGDLDCQGSTFHNPLVKKTESGKSVDVEGTGNALSADSAIIKGSVFLYKGFVADGRIRLAGAQIGGQITCRGGKFTDVISLQRASIRGSLVWQEIVEPGDSALDLVDASVDTIEDVVDSWPTPKNLFLDGLVYRRFSGDNVPKDARTRLDWLRLPNEFTQQPYRQLAKVLGEEGDDAGARLVLYTMECRRRATTRRAWNPAAGRHRVPPAVRRVWHEITRFASRAWNLTLKLTIGYGYYPGISLAWLLLLVALGWPIFRSGYFAANMVPVDKDAYPIFEKNHQPPPGYERFYASVYSLENSFPIVKLGQTDHWQPATDGGGSSPGRQNLIARATHAFVSPAFLRCFRWAQILFGWFFASMGVAGITGLLRKD